VLDGPGIELGSVPAVMAGKSNKKLLLRDENRIDSVFEFNNCPTRCELFRLLYFCRKLYMFRVVTPIIRSSYNCNYSFWY